MGKGIDYGMGQTNVDRETGIRFGVINMNELSHWAWDDFEADYGTASCPKCGGDAVDPDDAPDDDAEEGFKPYRKHGCCGDHYCLECKIYFDVEDAYGDEPNGHYLDDAEMKVTVGTDGDAFVLKSPYFTRAAFCSPCAPGACYLTDADDGGERAYCFGHEWFEDEKAPYPVYSVATGELVQPESN